MRNSAIHKIYLILCSDSLEFDANGRVHFCVLHDEWLLQFNFFTDFFKQGSRLDYSSFILGSSLSSRSIKGLCDCIKNVLISICKWHFLFSTFEVNFDDFTDIINTILSEGGLRLVLFSNLTFLNLSGGWIFQWWVIFQYVYLWFCLPPCQIF